MIGFSTLFQLWNRFIYDLSMFVPFHYLLACGIAFAVVGLILYLIFGGKK